MSFTDYLTFAVANIDADVPDHLLPITLMNDAAMAGHLSSDSFGAWA
ncbi:MAG: hypothetical protein NTX31_00305 [Burkholderiales bacterium]|nr:hypothetical protein [Burkholderiales bacterium]